MSDSSTKNGFTLSDWGQLALAIIGLSADLLAWISFISQFGNFSVAVSPPNALSGVLWISPLFRGFTFVLMVYSFYVFTIIVYKIRRKEYIDLIRRKNIKFLNIPFRKGIQTILDFFEENISSDDYKVGNYLGNLILVESVYTNLIVFPSLALIWVRAFWVDTSTPLIIASTLFIANILLAFLLFRGNSFSKSFIIAVIFLIPIYAGIFLSKDLSVWSFLLGILVGLISTIVILVTNIAIANLFSFVFSIFLFEGENQGFYIPKLLETANLTSQEKIANLADEVAGENPLKAIEYLNQALRKPKDNDQRNKWIEKRAMLYKKVGEIDKASQDYDFSIEHSNSEKNRLRLGKARMYFDVGRYKDAFGEYSMIAGDVDVSSYKVREIYYELAEKLVETGEIEFAKLAIQKYIQCHPTNDGYRKKAKLELLIKEYQAVIDDIGRAQKLDRWVSSDEYMEDMLLVGSSYKGLRQFDNAINCFKKISRGSEWAVAQINLAKIYQIKNDHLNAINILTKVVDESLVTYNTNWWSAHKSIPMPYFFRGISFYKVGEYDKADYDFTKCIEKDNQMYKAYFYRSKLGKATAKEDFETGCKLLSANYENFKEIIEMEVLDGNKTVALEIIKKVVFLEPNFKDKILKDIRSKEPLKQEPK